MKTQSKAIRRETYTTLWQVVERTQVLGKPKSGEESSRQHKDLHLDAQRTNSGWERLRFVRLRCRQVT